jgi:hypothetical protein
MTVENIPAIHLSMDREEWTLLRQILEEALSDLHAERRRTEAPAYHEQIVHREDVLRALVDRVRRAGA